jgi:hypothetical protein
MLFFPTGDGVRMLRNALQAPIPETSNSLSIAQPIEVPVTVNGKPALAEFVRPPYSPPGTVSVRVCPLPPEIGLASSITFNRRGGIASSCGGGNTLGSDVVEQVVYNIATGEINLNG